MKTLDLTPTWTGLLPALFAMLESGTGEGPAIAKQELARLAAWADSHNAQANIPAIEEPEKAANRCLAFAEESAFPGSLWAFQSADLFRGAAALYRRAGNPDFAAVVAARAEEAGPFVGAVLGHGALWVFDTKDRRDSWVSVYPNRFAVTPQKALLGAIEDPEKGRKEAMTRPIYSFPDCFVWSPYCDRPESIGDSAWQAKAAAFFSKGAKK